MQPPFFGTKVVTDIDLEKVYPHIDTKLLFSGQWRFKMSDEKAIKEKAYPALEEWKKCCSDEKILTPKVIYGYFKPGDFKGLSYKVQLSDFAPLQIVTVGEKVVARCKELFSANKYSDYLYLHGLAVVTAEALAEYWHMEILKELGVKNSSRISPGYPLWPDLKDQERLCELLNAKRIGIEVTETYQLVPEYSTSAMIIL